MTVDYNQKWKLGKGQSGPQSSKEYEAYKNEINRRYLERLVQNNERTTPIGNEFTKEKSGGFYTGQGAQPSQALGAGPAEQPAVVQDPGRTRVAPGAPVGPTGVGAGGPVPAPVAPAAPVQTNLQAANAPVAQPAAAVNPNRDVGVLGQMLEPGNAANRAAAPNIGAPASPFDLKAAMSRNAGTLPPEYGVGMTPGITPPEVLRQNVYSQLGAPPTSMGVTPGETLPYTFRGRPEQLPVGPEPPLIRESMPQAGGPGKGLYRMAQDEGQPPVEGDVNGDGQVNLVDAIWGLLGKRGTEGVNKVREAEAEVQTEGTPQSELAPTLGDRLPALLEWLFGNRK